MVRCAGCKLWFLSPRLTGEATNELYRSSDYFSGGATGYSDYAGQERSLRNTFRRLLRDLAAMGATGGRLLEVGSGLGYCLDESRRYFSQRCGIELSPSAAASAAELADAPVLQNVEDLDRDSQFDCIFALHVIEHVHRPVAFLRQLTRHLAPGGTLVLAAPHMGSLWRHVMGRHWPSFKFPEHVSFFDAATLKRLFADVGIAHPTRLPYLHDFPLSEILAKLHLPVPPQTERILIPLPATTICYAGRKTSGSAP